MSILCSTSIRSGKTLDEALGTIAGLGYKDVDVLGICEWCHVLPRQLAEDFDGVSGNVDMLLKKHDLTMCSMNIGTNQQLWDRTPESVAQRERELVALCRLMQLHNVGVAAVQPLSDDKTRDFKQVIDDCILSLCQFRDIGTHYGIDMGVELHFNSPFEHLDQINYLFEKMPDAKIVYDPSHLVMQGINPNDHTYLMDRAIHVHIRDAGKDTMQMHLGEGDVNFNEMINNLMDKGYTGHYSIEYLDDKNTDYLSDVPKLYSLITSIIRSKKTGLPI